MTVVAIAAVAVVLRAVAGLFGLLTVGVVVVVMRGRVRFHPGDIGNHRSGRCLSRDDAAAKSWLGGGGERGRITRVII